MHRYTSLLSHMKVADSGLSVGEFQLRYVPYIFVCSQNDDAN